MMKRFHPWLMQHGQVLINVYLFINIVGFIAWQCHALYVAQRLDLIEVVFIIHNLLLAWVVLIRRRHVAVDRHLGHQVIALVAFFSGLAFMGQPGATDPTVVLVSQVLMLISGVLGVVTLFNLGDSFGILIACRAVKTGGMYHLVRHPMYGTDILLRIGYLVSHFNGLTMVLFVVSSGCYVYRAMLEERFLLSQSEDYRPYMQKVRYRFIPGLF